MQHDDEYERDIFDLFRSTIDLDPMAWLHSCTQALGLWVGWHADKNIGGVFKGSVRQIDKCDAVQHVEQLVDTLDTMHDAPAIVCVAYLACGCTVTCTMEHIRVDMCDNHDGLVEGKRIEELWIERYKAHFSDASREMHQNVKTDSILHDSKAREILNDTFLKDLGL